MFKSMFDSFMRMRPSYRAALIILVLAVVWIGSGFIVGGHKASSSDAQAKAVDVPRPIATRR